MSVLLAVFLALAVSLFEQSLALNAPKQSSPNPNTCYRSVGYWGQNTVGTQYLSDRSKWEKPLAAYCNDNTWDIIVVSFNHILFNGNPPLPGLNFAFHCESTPFSGYPFLLSCPEIGADIQTCQAKGKKILLSVGGAAGAYSFSSEQQGRDYGDTLWKMFMGGSDTAFPRPFGSAIIDGIDFDVEGGSSIGWSSLARRLRELYDTDKNRYYYLGAAPQCPFPDAYMGPSASAALGNAWFDFVFIQFYNNYCGIQSYGSFFNFDTWNNWAKTVGTQVFVGVPGASYSGGGYQPASTVLQILNDMSTRYGPNAGGWLAGFMTWDVGSASDNSGTNGMSFAASISSKLKGMSPAGSCNSWPNPPSTSSSSSTSRTTTSSSSSSTSSTSSTSSSITSSTRTTLSSTSTSSSSSSRSSTSGGTRPTGRPTSCFCAESSDGYKKTRAPGYATKKCPDGQRGFMMRVCSLVTGGNCRWGSEFNYCIKRQRSG